MPTHRINDDTMRILFLFIFLLFVAVNCSVSRKDPNIKFSSAPEEPPNVEQHKNEANGEPMSESGAIVKPPSHSKEDSNLAHSNVNPITKEVVVDEKPHSRGVTNTSNYPAPPLDERKKDLQLMPYLPQKQEEKPKEIHDLIVIDHPSHHLPYNENGKTLETPKNATSIEKPTNQTIAAVPNINQPISKNSTAKQPVLVQPAIPQKPNVTYSVSDDPDELERLQKIAPKPPLVESLQDANFIEAQKRDEYYATYIFPAIGVIVMIPLLVIFANCTVRKVRDYWSKRSYRRMDYLIEDMYH